MNLLKLILESPFSQLVEKQAKANEKKWKHGFRFAFDELNEQKDSDSSLLEINNFCINPSETVPQDRMFREIFFATLSRVAKNIVDWLVCCESGSDYFDATSKLEECA